MRVLIQRVKEAKVLADGKPLGAIGKGYLLLVGVGAADTQADIDWMAAKIAALRIFEDDAGKINLDLSQVGGEILSLSQFTLYADTQRGNRPGFEEAAKPETARLLWEKFNEALRSKGFAVQEGRFGARMEVRLTNDGPFTIWLDSSRSWKSPRPV